MLIAALPVADAHRLIISIQEIRCARSRSTDDVRTNRGRIDLEGGTARTCEHLVITASCNQNIVAAATNQNVVACIGCYDVIQFVTCGDKVVASCECEVLHVGRKHITYRRD